MIQRLILFVALGILLFCNNLDAQDLLNIKNGGLVHASTGAIIKVNGGINISTGATFTQVGSGDLHIGGNFTNDGIFTAGSGIVYFDSTTNSIVTGLSAITFYDLYVNKTGVTNKTAQFAVNTIISRNFNVLAGIAQLADDANHTMTIDSNLTVANNATLNVQGTAVRAHEITLTGDITNNGTIDLRVNSSQANLTLVGDTNTTISGSGTTLDFADLTINKSSISRIVDFERDFTSNGGFVIPTIGTLNFGGTYTLSNEIFKSSANNYTINQNTKVILNNPNLTVAGQDANMNLAGELQILDGTFNIGTGGSNSSLKYNTLSKFTMSGGTLNIERVFARDFSVDTAQIDFTLNSGTINLGISRSTIANRGIFDMVDSSIFRMSAGSINIKQNSSSFSNGDYYNLSAKDTVTGGTLNFSPNINTNTETAYKINSKADIWNLTMLDNSGAASPKLEQVTNNLHVLNDFTIKGRGFLQSADTFYLSHDFINNANVAPRFDANNKVFVFNGANDQTISGSADSTLFYKIFLNKPETKNVISNMKLTISNELRLIGNNILNMGDYDLRIGVGAGIFPDETTVLSTANFDGSSGNFSPIKFVQFNGTVAGGSIIRELNIANPSGSLYYYRFPFGTPGLFSSFLFSFRKANTTVSSGAEIKVKVFGSQHPDISEPNIALKKYFRVNTNNLSVTAESYTIKMEYLKYSEFNGDSSKYDNVFFRNDNKWYDGGTRQDLQGYASFRYQDIPLTLLDGDWTAGPRSAFAAIYFSIANGNWNSPSTWSRVGYGQVAASNFPQSNLDLVYIGDNKKVTLNTINPEVRAIYVENTGRLDITDGNYITPAADLIDTLRVEDGGTLGIGDVNGINEVGSTGNVRNKFREFSSLATYIYNGVNNQVTGSALPNQINSLVVDNTGVTNNTLTLTKAIEVKQSLVINNGKLNIVSTDLKGETPNRTFTMTGGELQCATFPVNFSSPTFTAGTINFAGTSSFTIPSSAHPSTPVAQYYNLKISSALAANSYITFDPTGETKISNSFDISSLTIDPIPNSQRLLVSGSTINFNGTGDQTIPSGYATAKALVYRMNYDNLKISGSGIKTLGNPNDLTGVSGSDNYVDISGNVLVTAATLNSGGYDMRVRKNFTVSSGAIFQAASAKVLFNTSGNTNLVTTSGNSFYNLSVDDNSSTGVLQFLDDVTIDNNFVISISKIKTTTQTINLKGNLTQGGIFDLGTGTFVFKGTTDQTATFTGTGNLYNVDVNKTSGNVIVSGAGDIVISNNLKLTQGNIGGRPTDKAIQLNGTYTRTGPSPGHVDGILRMYFGIGPVSNTVFPVGYGANYYPYEIELTGGGGTAGYLEVNVNTAIVTGDVTTTILSTGKPNGAGISNVSNEYVPKRWELNANIANNTFQLGARTYTSKLNFVASEVSASFTPFFEVSQRNGTTNTNGWISTNTGTRTTSSVTFLDNEILPSNAKQFFYTGNPSNLTFYSVASGNWSDNTTWSTASYNSSDIAPRAPQSSDNVKIGDGKTVTLTADISINSGKVITVEKAGDSNLGGYLNLKTYKITGAGTFTLSSEGAIGIGDANGITTSGATGNIQTTTRNFNNTSAHYIYNGTGAQVTGNALPVQAGLNSTIALKTLQVDKPSGTLSITGTSPVTIYITDSLYFKSGGANLSTSIIKLSGNFRIIDGFSWTPGTTYNGSTGSGTGLALADSTTQAGGFIFNGGGSQYIWREGETDLTFLIFNRFSLSKATGEIISNTNIESRQVFFHPINRSNLNLRTFNKKLIVHAADNNFAVHRPGPSSGDANTASRDSLSVSTYGWINGRIIRLLGTSNDRIFPIGTNDRYTPGRLITNNVANGFLEFQALDGDHPNFNNTQINKNTNVQKYWEITRATNIPYAPTFTLGTGGTLQPRLFYTQNEPRGGVNPANVYNMFRYKGSSNDWDSCNYNGTPSSINTLTRVSLETSAIINTPTVVGDALFNTPSTADPSNNAIVLCVGQSGAGTERVFYSRQDGNWNDPNTWSSVAYGNATNTYNDYPKNASDIVNIGAASGDNHRVVLNTSPITIASCDVVKVNNGFGILSVPSENYLAGNQFVLKEGAELEVGSADGIVPLTANVTPIALSSYTFSQNSTSYTALTGATSISGNGSGDFTVANVDLGFTFNYINNPFTKVGLSFDGFLTMGGSITNVISNALSGGTNNNVIAPLGMNLFRRKNSVFRYGTTGSSPNKVFTVQWENVAPDTNKVSKDYTITQGTSTYTALSASRTNLTLTADDQTFTNISLPFNFTYKDSIFTKISINMDGYVALGSTVSNTTASPLSTGGASNYSICALGFQTSGSLSRKVGAELSYETVGSSPNREFVIQWKNFKHSSVADASNDINFQIRIKEDNSLMIHYSTINYTGANNAVEVGLRGANNTFNNGDIANFNSTSWTTPIAVGTANNNTIRFRSAVKPSAGQYIQWTPANASYNFQVELTEAGEVHFNYGSFTHPSAYSNTSAQVGMRGASASDFVTRAVGTTGSWASSTTGTAITNIANLRNANSVYPVANQRYSWKPLDWSTIPKTGSYGNIRASLIRNYNFNSLNNNRFAYIGSTNQTTGLGLPATVAKLQINNSGTSNNNIVTLSSAIQINDTLQLSDGVMKMANVADAVLLAGHLQNNSEANAITAYSSAHNFKFIGDSTIQRIYGTVDSTVFPMNVIIDKNNFVSDTVAGDVYITGHNVRMNGSLTFNSNSRLYLSDNKVLSLGESNTVFSSTGGFNNDRMIMVSGSATTGLIRKQFATGSNVNKNVTLPIGENSAGVNNEKYNETYFALNNMTFNANNYVNLSLKSTYPHPNAPNGTVNMMKKYWSFSSENIVRGTGTTDLSLLYTDAELIGNRVNYLPTAYRRAASGVLPGWSFILDNPTTKQVDTINHKIVVTGANRLIDHDWTAADPAEFSSGQIYYSRKSGLWSKSESWTNDATNTYSSQDTALNIPGYFPNDIVYISGGHTITYDSSLANPVEYIYINTNNISSGELKFASSSDVNSSKYLEIKNDLELGTNGLVSKTNASLTSKDTLIIGRNITNAATTVGKGFDLYKSANEYTLIKLNGTNNAIISGSGLFNNLASIMMKKTNPTNSVTVNSSTFCTGFSASINTNSAVDFILKSGTYIHNVASDITFTNDGDGDLMLESNVRLNIKAGRVIVEDGLICGQDSKVILESGNLKVGNAANENLYYESVTEMNLSGNSTLQVAGNFRRRFPTSSASLYIAGTSLIEVMMDGSTTNTAVDQRRAGFDIGEASSIFQMSGGTIKLYRPMASNGGVKDPDFLINASADNSFISAGTVQIGVDGLSPAVPAAGGSYDNMNILSTLQFYNLTFQNTYARDIEFGTGEMKVKNNFLVNTNSQVSMNGQNLTVGGDFSVLGSAIFKTGTSGTRVVKLNGTSTQNLRIENTTFNNTYFGFYDFIADKTAGDIVLPSDAVGSDLLIRNSLQFSSNNIAKILANGTHYVRVGESVGTPGSVQRFKDGWIVGQLKRWINDGAYVYNYPVGTSTQYTPVSITTSVGTGTPGYLNVRPVGSDPADIPDVLLMEPSTYIQRYWNISPNNTSPFALGSGRTYSLTLQYVKGTAPSGDLRNDATYGIFEIFRRYPSFDSAGASTWNLHTGINRTDSSTTTQNVNAFGSFIIGEPAGETFYSIANGDWQDPTVWSKTGYDGPPETSDYPKQQGDIVKIGNGKHITMTDGYNQKLKSVIVESINGNKGKLSILGGARVLGLVFQLKDSCTLETDDNYGFTRLSGPTYKAGAVYTTVSRIFGKSRYEYIANEGATVGDGLPLEVFTILVNNSGTNSQTNYVALSDTSIRVIDTLYVKKGVFSLKEKELNLYGQLVMDNGTYIDYGTGKFRLSGSQNQMLRINTDEMATYDMIVDKSAGTLTLDGNKADSKIRIKNNLKFATNNTAKLDVRTNNKYILLDTLASVSRDGFGFVDGRARLYFPSGTSTKLFPIGINNDNMYASVEMTTNANDTVKFVDGIIKSGPPSEPLYGNRLNTSRRLEYYWSLVPADSTDSQISTRSFKTKFRVPNSLISNVTIPSSVVRRRSIFGEAGGSWTERRYDQLTWNTDTSTVEFQVATTPWTGLGEFFIGEKAQRIFYSKTNGNWNSNNTWSFSADGSVAVPSGLYPNSDWSLTSEFETEKRDSVIIQNSDSVYLNTNPELAFIQLKDNANLVISNTNYLSQSSVGTSIADFVNGTLENKSALGLSSTLSNSIVRFSSINYGSSLNFEFSGNVQQTFGDAFPQNIDTIIINNSGSLNNAIVGLPSGSFSINNLVINSGDLRPSDNTSILRSTGSLVLNDTLNLTRDITGTNVTSQSFIFDGSGSTNQTFSSSFPATFYNMAMNRGAGTGFVEIKSPISISNILDMRDGANANQQILQIGDGGFIKMLSTSPSAITDVSSSGTLRAIRTTETGGSLILNIAANNTYTYPLISLEGGNNIYAPATWVAGSSGTSGFMGVRTSSGTNTNSIDAHAYVSAAASDYIKRYWAIDSTTSTITGQMTFAYDNLDLFGSENNIDAIGQWSGTKENPSGSWQKYITGLNLASNTFVTASNVSPSSIQGDWTIANLAAFTRIFYSRQSGNWTSNSSWTINPTHTGSPFPGGATPIAYGDSVVIGGGVNGLNNHVINFDMPNVSLLGLAVGIGASNTGTLNFNDGYISGDNFTFGDKSTIITSNANGFTALGTNTGAIRTTLKRQYNSNSNYEYSGTVAQTTGNGLPANVASLTLSGTNTVTSTNAISVKDSLKISSSGILDTRTNANKVTVESTASVIRTGSGFVDGTMSRHFASGTVSNVKFDIGANNVYAGATLSLNGTGGTAGYVDGIVMQPVPSQIDTGNRMSTVNKINRYWKFIDGSAFAKGTRTLNTKFDLPDAELTVLNQSNTVIRHRSIPAETWPWTEKRGSDLAWTGSNPTNLALSGTASDWTTLGDFYIGEKAQRIFYSNGSGDWTNSSNWSFSADGSTTIPSGLFPNPDWNAPAGYETETRDSVVILASDSIYLNTNPELAYINTIEQGKLTIGNGQYLSPSSIGISKADFSSGTIDNKSSQGIQSNLSNSIIRFNTNDVSYGNNLNIAFSGSVQQTFGDAYPSNVDSTIIANTGTGTNSIVGLPSGELTLSNLIIQQGDLRPSDNTSNLRLTGNVHLADTLDLTKTTAGVDVSSQTLTLQGSGSSNQIIDGAGALIVHNLTMNRGAGTGTSELQTIVKVENVLDLREGTNANNQLLQIGNNGLLSIESCLATAISDYNASTPSRFILTSPTSGSLIRNICASATYVFPTGSVESGNTIYAPATYISGASGTTGTMGIRTSSGSSVDFSGGHKNLAGSTTDYIKRYWALDSVTTTLLGDLSFVYDNLDISGIESNMDAIGKWNSPKEGLNSIWNKYLTGLDLANNKINAPTNTNPTTLAGDWTAANLAAFMRVFYSRQTGNWNDNNSWTGNPTHVGSPYPGGGFPSVAGDSVVIGGGSNGLNNHVISFNIASAIIDGLSVGTSSSNTGTLLMTDNNYLQLNNFKLNLKSTLGVGADDGINLVASGIGNIRASNTAVFSKEANYIYNGSNSQTTGTALPDSVLGFSVESTEIVKATNSFYVQDSLKFTSSGILDTRTNAKKVLVENSGQVLRTGTGYVDGILSRYIPSGAVSNVKFDIGANEKYSAAYLSFTGSDGTAGYVDGIVLFPVPNQIDTGNRLSTVNKINRYWTFVDGLDFALGTRTISTSFDIKASETSVLNQSNTVVRHRSIPTETWPWTERRASELTWTGTDPKNIALAVAANKWTTLGDFYIGEKAQRIFYSKGSGDWTNSANWSFSADGSTAVPSGLFPNPDWNAPIGYETEVRDSVVIMNADSIYLNINPELAYINTSDDSKLTIANNQYLSPSSIGTSKADFNSGTIDNKSSQGFDSIAANSIIRFDLNDITYGTNLNVSFSGNVQQTMGNAYPTNIDSTIIANTGSGNNSIVGLPSGDLTITNLIIQQGNLRPSDNTSNLHLTGSLHLGDTLDLTINTAGANVSTSTLTLQGSGNTDQIIDGSGALIVHDITMNRGTGTGITELQSILKVENVLDMQSGSNANNQILKIADSALISIESCDVNAILDFNASSPKRFIATTQTGGSLIRNICANGTYLYPIGSIESTNLIYSPATYISGSGSTTGTIGLRTSSGTNSTFDGGHLQLNSLASDFIKRYYAVDSVTTNITGQFVFAYDNLDLSGSESNINAIGKWSDVKEGSSGYWNKFNSILDLSNNQFKSAANSDPNNLVGDWTIGNAAAFLRMFFSRQSGNWNDNNSWTANSSHSGTAYPNGVFPNALGDSVVIGGGNLAVNDHQITLNLDSVEVQGVSVGTSSTNTGTLILDDNFILGENFVLSDYSTLKISDTLGINLIGSNTGNIRTSLARTFSTLGNYEYTASANQVSGSALPATVRNLVVNNSGALANNTLTLQSSVSVSNLMHLTSGRLDLGTNNISSPGAGSTMTLDTLTTLRIGSTNTLLTSANGFTNYNINVKNTIEFYGTDQVISNLPTNLTLGLGNVILNNTGTKSVSAPLLIRGDLTISTNATLLNNVGVNALSVYGNVRNSSILNNNGILEIGR